MNTKNVNKLVIIPLVFILVLTLSITYALFTKEVNTNNRNITLSSINKYIGIYGPNKNNIELNKDYTFTIENRGSIGTGYEIYIESETNIDLSTITYQVTGDITASGNLSNSAIIYSALSSDDKKTITLRLTSTSTESYIGKIKVRYKDYVVNFDYTGDYQTFNAPTGGNYKLEVWGAEGYKYTGTYYGGYGGYSVGTIALDKNPLYVFVGQKGNGGTVTAGTISFSSYPNGGTSWNVYEPYTTYTGSGGGSTHISKINSIISRHSSSDLDKLLIVAGGGGSSIYNANWSGSGGHAGGYIGNSGIRIKTDSGNWQAGTGGTQNTGGKYIILSDPNAPTGLDGYFGQGGIAQSYPGSGGGGGYYGGAASYGSASGGGSGYIGNAALTNKKMVCYSCQTSTAVATKTETKACHNTLPTVDCAKEGNGYARITYIGN